jgi:hypothetical protein
MRAIIRDDHEAVLDLADFPVSEAEGLLVRQAAG